ncbi:RcnB family protein [Cupriavidus sp. DL-D2]|uniref:RcnB family protein n=1 Tax=Cupriavidus sp. DL-D2 TaxID=3144974 RepID=UPI0032155CD7
MQKKTLIPAVLIALGMLAAPIAQAQQPQPMPGQPQPSGPRPMPAPGQAGAMPPNAQPMPPASGGRSPGMTPGMRGGPGQGMQDPGMRQGMPQPSGNMPMGAQSPYTPKTWQKGDKLPTEFRDRQYVIDKYKDYNLPAPRKGHHWVGVGADYYQVSSNGTIYSVGPN